MGKKKAIKQSVELVGRALMGMVAAPGVKKKTGVSRSESIALAYGLSIGLGVGYELATDAYRCERFLGVTDGKPISKENAASGAGILLANLIEDFPEHRDHMLSLDDDTKSVMKLTIEHDGEVH